MRIDTIFKHTNKTLPNVLVYFIRISLDLLSGKFSQRYHGPDWEFKKKRSNLAMSFKMLPQATINSRQGTENLAQVWQLGSLEIPLEFWHRNGSVHPISSEACNFHHIMTDMNHFSRSGDVLPTCGVEAVIFENPDNQDYVMLQRNLVQDMHIWCQMSRIMV